MRQNSAIHLPDTKKMTECPHDVFQYGHYNDNGNCGKCKRNLLVFWPQHQYHFSCYKIIIVQDNDENENTVMGTVMSETMRKNASSNSPYIRSYLPNAGYRARIRSSCHIMCHPVDPFFVSCLLVCDSSSPFWYNKFQRGEQPVP